jgi:hypothetical protein
MARAAGLKVIICTSRDASYQGQTLAWLEAKGVAHDAIYMRPHGELSSDVAVKQWMLEQVKADGFDPVLAFEDNADVAQAWSRMGLTCLVPVHA